MESEPFVPEEITKLIIKLGAVAVVIIILVYFALKFAGVRLL